MKTSLSIILTACALLSCVALAKVNDPFADGCRSYAAADYIVAKAQFVAAAKATPKSWKAQYQLGNTYLQLKDPDNAKKAYEKCLTLKPDDTTKKHCEEAIAYLIQKPAPPPPPEPRRQEVQVIRGSSLGDPSSGSSGQDWRQQAIDARKAQIMADAERRAEKIRADGAAAIEEGNALYGRRYRSRETGERFTQMNPDDIAAMKRDIEQRAKHELQEGRKQADQVTTP